MELRLVTASRWKFILSFNQQLICNLFQHLWYRCVEWDCTMGFSPSSHFIFPYYTLRKLFLKWICVMAYFIVCMISTWESFNNTLLCRHIVYSISAIANKNLVSNQGLYTTGLQFSQNLRKDDSSYIYIFWPFFVTLSNVVWDVFLNFSVLQFWLSKNIT